VMSIAILKQLLQRLGVDGQRPFEMFDIICGTSTGGIISVMLGMYDYVYTYSQV
jgi:patatin-like phospholipase/acyl hydrolase